MNRILVAVGDQQQATAMALQLRSVGGEVADLGGPEVSVAMPSLGSLTITVVVGGPGALSRVAAHNDIFGAAAIAGVADGDYVNALRPLTELVKHHGSHIPVAVGVSDEVTDELSSWVAGALGRRVVEIPIFSFDLRSRSDVLVLLSTVLFLGGERVSS